MNQFKRYITCMFCLIVLTGCVSHDQSQSSKINSVSDQFVYSPSDLCRFISSPFASWVEHYSIECPENGYESDETDSMMGLLQHKGEAYEAVLLDEFRAQGKNILVIVGASTEEKRTNTLTAMAAGAEVIFQACLECPPFRGYADFLVKVPARVSLVTISTKYGIPSYQNHPSPILRCNYVVMQKCWQKIRAAIPMTS